MIMYVIMETAEKYLAGNWHRPRLTFEETSGDFCLMIHYKQLSLKMLSVLCPKAIVYSGASTPFEDYDVRQTRNYRQVVMSSSIPQLGICGGHQLAAEFFGCTLGSMHLIGCGEADHNPKYHPGEFKEWGVYPVTVLQKDPLFNGLDKIIRVQQYHRSEIKKVGGDIVTLASSPACRVQAFRHRTRPFYGVQFHPEEACEGYPDGYVILRNFFKWAAARQK